MRDDHPGKPPPLRPGRLVTLAAGLLAAAGCAALEPGAEPGSAAEPSKLLSMPPKRAQQRYESPLVRSELRERALEALATLALDEDAQVRANAVEALEIVPSRAAPTAAVGLKDENPGVRATACMVAGRLRLRGLAASIEPLRSDPSPFVRAAAIYALVRIDQSQDPTPLATVLLGDPSPRVRAHVAFILGELGNRSALGLLREALRDGMPRANQAEVRILRLQIAEAMIKLGDTEQVEAVRAALYPSRQEDVELVPLAVQILGEVRDRGSVNQLTFLSSRRNEAGQEMPAEVRMAVAWALAKMGKTEGSFIAEEFKAHRLPVLRAQAAHVYGETRRVENLARLEALLADPSPTVRVAAAGGILKVTDGSGQ